MDASPKEAFYYRTAHGYCPCEEWIESFKDRKGSAKIRAKIARARAGNLGKCGTVGHGVLELKIDFGPGYLLYFGEHGNKIIILLCGGDKSTQEKDIKLAHTYWTD